MEIELWQLAIYFFLVALVYSSAGFGGGSSYLAILALTAIPFVEIRMLALLCNIAVVAGSVYLTWRNNLLDIRRVLPLVFFSIPCAYIAGTLRIEEDLFFVILGITLIIAALLMLIPKFARDESVEMRQSYLTTGIMGGCIGFLSGLVGIGGGIFLSPLLYLTGWGPAKAIAATTAFFILANSLAGLTGQMYTYGWSLSITTVMMLLAAVILGGQLGIRLTLNRLSPIMIKRVTAALIVIVAIRLLS